jgi:hypothetical protein
MNLSVVVDVITAVAVSLGIILGLLQLRHYHLSREREAALFLLNSFQTVELFQGIWIIQELPNGLSKKDLEDKLGEETRLVYLVLSIWERIGILVFNHEILIDMVDDAYGDQIICSWHRLQKYVIDVRNDLQRETSFEWFQWLAEKLIAQEAATPPIPAYRAHRDWR